MANLSLVGLEEEIGKSSLAAGPPGDEELVALAKDGDVAATETLLNRYRHFARAKARTYFLVGADRDDLVQEAMIGLFKAIRNYDSGKEVDFHRFAELCIKRHVITAIKGATRNKHVPLNSYVSFDKPTTQSSRHDDGLQIDVLPSYSEWDPAEILISLESFATLSQTIRSSLSALEQNVLRLYMEGRSYQEISDTLGREVKVIDNALNRIKRKLKATIQSSSSPPELVARKPPARPEASLSSDF